MEEELNRAAVGFRKNDNAFLAVDVKAVQAAADRLRPKESASWKCCCMRASSLTVGG